MTSLEQVAAAPRVLVVDDSSLIRLYYRDVLEKCGYDVDQAMNGLEAMERVLAQPFDLLIVDVNMPKMDGFSFVRELRRSNSQAAAVPILIITTEAGREDTEEARAVGANFYLVKPVSEADLRDHVAVLTGCRR